MYVCKGFIIFAFLLNLGFMYTTPSYSTDANVSIKDIFWLTIANSIECDLSTNDLNFLATIITTENANMLHPEPIILLKEKSTILLEDNAYDVFYEQQQIIQNYRSGAKGK